MKKNNYKAIFIALVSILWAYTLLPLQQVNSQTGKGTIEALINIFSDPQSSHTSFSKLQLAEAANHIDYKTMAENALGTNYWDKLSPQQRKIYLQSFESLIEQRYYKRWHRVFSRNKITYEGEEKLLSGDVIVKTKITTGDDCKTALWTLKGENLKVINLTVDEQDLIKRANARFHRKIAGVGIPAFIAWIQHRAKYPDTDES